MSGEVRARLWHTGGRFYAQVLDAPVFLEVTGVSRRECLAALRKATGDDVALTVEVVPEVVGVAEAAEIMNWDKRRVVTYIDRGSFPEPITALASGRIWLREDVQTYADEWRARRAARAGRVNAGSGNAGSADAGSADAGSGNATHTEVASAT